ncbi:MAG: MATE family efflux transporter [Muribaculaceae bacterium]|nr:MATE family efflux transporter [Muribaculaceae bacterium]
MISLRRQILAIALPAIISNITTPLLAMIDVAIVGHIGSAVYIAAIALGSSMFNMLYWLFGFLRMGSSGITAQAFGAGDIRSTSVLLYRALLVGLVVGLIILSLGHPVADIMLRFMDADASTLPLARSYFLIAIAGAPATLGSFALSGWFLGMQNSHAPMWMALVTNIVNIATSLTLVFVFSMDIKGVAIGSATAQWTGFIFGLIWAITTYRPIFPGVAELLRLTELRRFFSINADIFLRTLCLVAVTVWFTRAGSIQGADILAANALLLQLFMFFSYFMDGFAFAGEALAGKYEGSRNRTALNSLIGALIRIGAVLAVTFSVIYWLFGGNILSMLTDDINVLTVCAHYRWWAVVVPVAGTMAFIWDGILIGLTRTRVMLASMTMASALFFAVYFLSRNSMSNHGLWLAFIIYLAARGIIEHIIYKKSDRPSQSSRL